MPVLLSVVGGLVAAVGLALVALTMVSEEPARASLLVALATTALMGGVVLLGAAAVVAELRRIAATMLGRGSVAAAKVRANRAGGIQFPARQKRAAGEVEAPPLQANGGAVAARRAAAGAAAGPDVAAPAVVAADDGLAADAGHAEAAAAGSAKDEKDEAAAVSSASEAGAPVAGEPTDASRRPAEPIARAPTRSEAFDSFWPPEARVARNRQTRAQPASQGAAAAASETATAPEAQSHAEEAPAPPLVSIVKSGVVDGMAYTLYSDGSIEAQLAQGTIRFRSLNELRMHLERAA